VPEAKVAVTPFNKEAEPFPSDGVGEAVPPGTASAAVPLKFQRITVSCDQVVVKLNKEINTTKTKL
jgi:hypothetical protein